MAALLGAQQVPGAADFQVAHGNLEAAAQRRILLDRAEPLAHVCYQSPVARQEQVGIGLMLVTAHAPAKLVKIAQTKTIRAIDNNRVRIWNIQSTFNDRRREQHVCLAIDECCHHFLQFIAVHLAVADEDARARQQSAQFLRHGFNCHHPIVQEKDLPAAVELALNGIAN